MRVNSGDRDDDDERPRRVASSLQDEFQPAHVAVGGDGAMMVTGTPPPLQLRDEDWICTRGPCRHFMHVVTNLDAQGPLDGSAGAEVRQSVYSCFPAPGREMELSGDSIIYDCNLWDPRDPDSPAERALEARRAAYHARELDVRKPGGIVAWVLRALGRIER